MTFDKNAWDPTPAQLSVFAVVIAWGSAYLLEWLILNETDVSGVFRSILAALTGSGSLELIWKPIVFGIVIPFFSIWGIMMFNQKDLKYKRIVLTAGTVGLIAVLVLIDLKFPPS